MAISFDSATSTNFDASSATFSHTVGAGSNKILIVDVNQRIGVEPVATAITFSGVSLTKNYLQNVANSIINEQWYLLNPPSATADVVITLNGSAKGTAGAVSYFGVHQTVPFGASGTFSNTNSNAPSGDVTSIYDNSWIIGFVGQRTPATITGTAASNIGRGRWVNNTTGNPSNGNASGYGDDAVGAASGTTVTMTYSSTATSAVGWVGTELHAAAAASAEYSQIFMV